MNERKLFENTTEPERLADTVTENEQEQVADDMVADTQPTEDTTADVSEQTGGKKQRRKRTKQPDDTSETADIAKSDTDDKEDSDVEDNAKEAVAEKQYKMGDPVDIRLALLYSSSVAPKHFKGIKGRYYIWDDTAVNGRVRLTDSPSGVGKPERIIGWIKLKNIQ